MDLVIHESTISSQSDLSFVRNANLAGKNLLSILGYHQEAGIDLSIDLGIHLTRK